MSIDLSAYGIKVADITHNAPTARLYEMALRWEHGCALASNGAIIAYSADKTGRSPKDKRIVDEPSTTGDVWWGSVNIKIGPEGFATQRARAIDYLNTRGGLYVIDGFAGWDPAYQLKVRVITERAYHALFMRNMLIRPTPEQLLGFGEPDYVIFNAGKCDADTSVEGVTSKTSVCLSFEHREMVILGTQYAGEMKKGVFTVMNYLMPRQGVLSMHCSATEGHDGRTSVLFGLSGTGKTTLSADPSRQLIGDDEHCWTDDGIFNIEGGCYAKMVDLSAENEPDIYNAVRYGAVLENVIYDADSREIDYSDVSITENTRGSYPVEFMPSAKVPCVGTHPSDIIFLTCDAFGVLPPVAALTHDQAMYHFISGYTAKVAGTEVGVTDPEVTFSACFGSPFLVWHPSKYAELLVEKAKQHGSRIWLVNTGWSGGGHGVGRRMPIRVSRAIVDAIHTGALRDAETVEHPVFGFRVPTSCPGVDGKVLAAKASWADKDAYDATARKLAGLFRANFKKYEAGVSQSVIDAGPRA